MNVKKIISLIASVCIAASAIPSVNISVGSVSETYATDTQKADGTIELKCIGDSQKIDILGGAEATWKSDNEKVAKVDSDGTITAVGKGSCFVYAVIGTQTLTFSVTVEGAEPVIETTVVEVGTFKLNNTNNTASPSLEGVKNTDIKWNSSDSKVATVDADGTIHAVGKGKATITGSINNYIYKIEIESEYDPSTIVPSIVEEKISDLTFSNEEFTRKIDNNGDNAKWESTDPSVVKVDEKGLITAVNSGKCQIFTIVNNVRYYFDVTSTFNPEKPVKPIEAGVIELSSAKPSQKLNLNIAEEGAEIEWSCDNENVAKVDSEGVVTAVSSGECKVLAKLNGLVYSVTIKSTYNPSEVPTESKKTFEIKGVGKTIQLQAGSSSEANLKFTSKDEKIATVDKNGLVTAVGIGETEVVIDMGNSAVTVIISVVSDVLYGDANCDGDVTIADAVAILQYLANKSKYPITEQGLKNADVFSTGDGISGQDALAIQRYDAHVVEKLPIE